MERWIKMSKKFNVALGIAALLLLSSAPLISVEVAMAQNHNDAEVSAPASDTASAEGLVNNETSHTVKGWAFVAAAVATGLGSIAAGYAVGQVGTAAMGAVAEKPELMGKSLIYVALAEGIAIYGLLISIIILAKV